MIIHRLLFVLLVALLFLAPPPTEAAEPKEVELLFVQGAEGARYGDGRLTLANVSPTTIFFADRPERVAGHVTTADFLRSWNEGKYSFEKDPPNAVLSVLTQGEVKNIVVTLSNPRLEGDDLLFDVKVLQGEVPAEAGSATLFIDGVIGAGRRGDPEEGSQSEAAEEQVGLRESRHRWVDSPS